MSAVQFSDAQLAAGLARVAPSAAPGGLRDRILAEAEATRQVRPVPGLLRRLVDADTIARRRVMLLAAAALLAMGLATAGVVGALIDERRETIPDLSLAPPTDLPAFVRSTYELMPELPPMTITFMDGGTKGRIHVDASGAIRTEWFASPDDTEPERYTIRSGTRRADVAIVDGRQVWSVQDGAISEDPRVFVYAALGAGRSFPQPGCETAVSPGEEYVGEPARGWEYVGLEYVAGRPTHHVRCGEDLWIDVETRLTLRSRGAMIGKDFQPIAGSVHTVEATEVVFGQPPSNLFAMSQPDGIATISPDELQCAEDPYCSASPRPIVAPPSAPPDTEPLDLDAIIAAALVPLDPLPAFDVTIEHTNTKYPGSTTRTVHDGDGRSRIEAMFEGQAEPAAWITLTGPDYRFATESTTDGFRFWRDRSEELKYEPSISYPLSLPGKCAGGWTLLGTDVVAGRIADHVACAGIVVPDEYWIDRETHLVLRQQTMSEARYGTDVSEVVELRLGPSPPELFELPPGAEVRD